MEELKETRYLTPPNRWGRIMPSWLSSDWLFGSLAWELVFRLLALSYLTDVVWWPLGHFFGLFKTKLQATVFLLLVPLAIFLIMIGFSDTAKQSPDLYLKDLRTEYGGRSTDGRFKNVFNISVRIFNKGSMPSSLQNISVNVELADGSKHQAQIAYVKDAADFSGESQQYTIYPSSLLIEKALNPIPVGGSVTGNVFGSFPDLQDDALKTAKSFIIAFDDVSGRKIATNIPIDHSLQYVPGYVPGLDNNP